MAKLRQWRRLTLIASAVTTALVIGWGVSHGRSRSSPITRLLSKAYGEKRTLELRTCESAYSSLRVERGANAAPFDRSGSLLEAEAEIARKLRASPGDPALLLARGEANLLEWSYEAAISDLQAALDADPKSALILNGLAAAYFERAEAQQRFADYGTAFEFESEALGASPDDPLVLFNRAILSERLWLYQSSIEDWNRYLRSIPSGPWADEARRRLGDVEARVAGHDQRTKPALLTPEEFVRDVDHSKPESWMRAEPRIEEYLSAAIREWLPLAFQNTNSSASASATRAVENLARILKEKHGDQWLADLSATRRSDLLVEASVALSRALANDSVSEDYASGRREALRAAELFSRAGSTAGAMRAWLEEVYALHFADDGPECLKKAAQLLPRLSGRSYRWIEIQLELEESVCEQLTNNLGRAAELSAEAYRNAGAAQYPGLSLRAAGFWANELNEEGRHREAWNLCRRALEQYWQKATRPMPGYNLYVLMDHLAAPSEPWHFQTALEEQALALLSPDEYPVLRAFEHIRVARAAVKANLPAKARENFAAAEQLFERAPATAFTEDVRISTEVELAGIAGSAALTEASLYRLLALRPRLDRIANSYVAGEYFRAIGTLQIAAGHAQSAQGAFENAVALIEEKRASLHSQTDQAGWAQQAVESYRGLVDAKLRSEDPVGALAVWEIYREEVFLPPRRSAPVRSAGGMDSQVEALRDEVAAEAKVLGSHPASLRGAAALVYVTTPHGIAVWHFNGGGMAHHLIEKDPAYVRMLVRRFHELCSSPASSLTAVRATAQRLYNLLIAPVGGELRVGQVLVIEADGLLARVPFQALVDPAGRYLSDDHPIVYARGLRKLAEHSPVVFPPFGTLRALVVGSGATGGDAALRPLPDAVAEARGVADHFSNARVLLEGEATTANVMRELPQASIFHFAGHTQSEGDRIGLLLGARGMREQSALLDATALEGISLARLQLAFLSACSTENGAEGEELDAQSLARPFLRAGVPHVVVTRWKVDSVASKALVQAFYQALIAGRSVAQSLVLAQARVRQAEPHPYYWAAFDAFGEP